MKSSIYNIFIPMKDDEYILFNTLSGSILRIDEELKECLEEEKTLMRLENRLLNNLEKLGIVVGNGVDERKIFEYNYNKKKYSAEDSSFIIYPTYGCNLSCSYCYEKALRLPKKTMDKTVRDRVIKFMKKTIIENSSMQVNVGFFGGEPLLEYEMCAEIYKEMFEWTKKLNIRFYATLTTNGTLFSDETIEKIGSFISSLQITLDGCKEVHDKMRYYSDGSGTYKDIMETVSCFLGKGVHVSLRVHIDDEPNGIEALLLDLKQRGFNKFPYFHLYFSLVAPSNACLHYHEIGYEKKAWDLFPKLKALAIKNGFKESIEKGTSLKGRIQSLCGYVKKGVYMIDPFGDIYICPVFTGHKEYSVGSLTAEGEARWNQVYYDIITRNPASIAGCLDCVLLPLCEGGCPISAHMKYKTFNALNCDPEDFSLEQKVQFYLRQYYPKKF